VQSYLSGLRPFQNCMPRSSDHFEGSERPSTMPAPELNPLVNPLLGQNMGRWAEVYYRNPPENRDHAVLELLQQLETENSARQGGATAAPLTQTSERDSAPFPRESSERSIRCPSCGHENDYPQRFCGMCGRPFGSAAASSSSMVEDGIVDDAQQGVFRKSDARFEEVRDRGQYYARDDSASNYHSESDSEGLIRSLGYATASTSYRAYIGVVLVIIIAALGYIAWKGARATGSSPLATQAPPAAAAPSAGQPPAPAAAKAAVPTPDNSASATTAGMSAGVASAKANLAEADVAKTDVAKGASTAPVTKQPDAKGAPAGAIGNGSEELAIAKKYLNPSGGTQPNTAEAVDWLWKAVAKRNTEATLLLSDLYLRGSGIPKNCDQARVLLDAAASRGTKDAAVRLQNMQAFGCP
jgi:pyruvate/2-oxoglutarate dehydrogenase complex dihydrolipoamide acyltransferase (E2) component